MKLKCDAIKTVFVDRLTDNLIPIFIVFWRSIRLFHSGIVMQANTFGRSNTYIFPDVKTDIIEME